MPLVAQAGQTRQNKNLWHLRLTTRIKLRQIYVLLYWSARCCSWKTDKMPSKSRFSVGISSRIGIRLMYHVVDYYKIYVLCTEMRIL
jgi:hypothetical protein